MSVSVLMIGSEALPFSKTGGLADVLGALPVALGRLGHRVTLVTPKYGGTQAHGATKVIQVAGVGGAVSETRVVEQPVAENVKVVLVDRPELLRSRLSLWCGRRLSGQPAAFRVPVRRGPRIRAAKRRVLRHSPRPRLAGRPRTGVPAHALRGRAPVARHDLDLHDSQSRLPGDLPVRVARAVGARPGDDVDGRDGVLGTDQPAEGGHRVLR